VAKVRKKPSLRKGTKTKRKKMPHIRAGYKDPLPKKKLIRPTIQVKNLTCLLTRVLFQESRRPSPMQSKQCRHFQRRLISKPLTLNRSLKPFLPPLSSKICVTPRLLILGTHHAWIRRTISLPQARKQRWKPSSKKTSKKNLNTLQHTHTHTHTQLHENTKLAQRNERLWKQKKVPERKEKNFFNERFQDGYLLVYTQ
jgi:hypothetical protein